MVNDMKIVKRDGRTVDYNPDKIRVAIGKANNEVSEIDKIEPSKIEEIIKYIENLDKKRMLVEDIQDIIEFKLMEYDAYALAKKYIIYRYKRSIIRQSNTTDVSILSIMKNGYSSSGAYLVANKQRDVLAGETSKDLAYRLLLPRNVATADKAGYIKFTNIEHFTELVIESVKIDLSKMLNSGTVINGIRVEPPKSFQSACNVLVEIIMSISLCQTGPIYIELKDLFKYYELSYEKKYSMYESLMKSSLEESQIRALSETQSFLEVKTGIQTILYQLNTLNLPGGDVPLVYFLVDTEAISSEHEEKLVFEFIREKMLGLKDESGKSVPAKTPGVIVSVDMSGENRYDYILHELINSNVDFYAVSHERYDSLLTSLKRFSQGSMILNMAKIASDCSDFTEFKKLLEDNLNYCYEGFLCRNHNLQGLLSDKSPIHWQYGAIANLESGSRIDDYLKKDKSVMILDILGFEASLKILKLNESDKCEIRNMITSTIKRWNKENYFEVILSNYCSSETLGEMFGTKETELKKSSVRELYDSFEFMKENYFESGYLYLVTNSGEDIINSDILSKGYIVLKENDD